MPDYQVGTRYHSVSEEQGVKPADLAKYGFATVKEKVK
jgi:hypothetical protein